MIVDRKFLHLLLHTMLRTFVKVSLYRGNSSKIPKPLLGRVDNINQYLKEPSIPVKCFGKTKSGDPKHPLMLGYDTELVYYL